MDSKLLPIIHPMITGLVTEQSDEVFKLIELFGSPLHIIFPQLMQNTIKNFQNTLKAESVKAGTIYFAAKANKANAFHSVSAYSGIGVDVSSMQEFNAALNAGVKGELISVSGPTKKPALLTLALLHNAIITVDEPNELLSLLEIAEKMPGKKNGRISIRISHNESSRFGMTLKQITDLFPVLVKNQSLIQLIGFSFHVSGYESNKRIEMITHACNAIEAANTFGLHPKHINIGGGLKVAYAKSNNWDMKKATEREFAANIKPQFVYPYTSEIHGYEQLKEILKASKQTIQKTSSVIGQDIQIDIEAGRSLLDQAGISIFAVAGLRTIGNRSLIIADGTSRSLSEFWRNSEFLIDPVHIAKTPRKNKSFSAAIASNTCLESDYLTRRFIPFDSQVEIGDLLVFINTAGYQMDSKESEFHRLPIPEKVVALKDGKDWHFIRDSIFSVADLLKNEKEGKRT